MDEYTLDADLIDKGHEACEFFVDQINKLTLLACLIILLGKYLQHTKI
jgi:hypothetical protein